MEARKIDRYQSALQQLESDGPDAYEPKSAREIVEYLRDDIERLFANGFSIISICDALAKANDGIASVTFQNHIRKLKKKIDSIPMRKKANSRKTKSVSGAVSESILEADSDNLEQAEAQAETPEAMGKEEPHRADEAKKGTGTIDDGSDFPLFSDKV